MFKTTGHLMFQFEHRMTGCFALHRYLGGELALYALSQKVANLLSKSSAFCTKRRCPQWGGINLR